MQVDREIEERARGLGAGHDDPMDSAEGVRDADAQRVKEEVAQHAVHSHYIDHRWSLSSACHACFHSVGVSSRVVILSFVSPTRVTPCR